MDWKTWTCNFERRFRYCRVVDLKVPNRELIRSDDSEGKEGITLIFNSKESLNLSQKYQNEQNARVGRAKCAGVIVLIIGSLSTKTTTATKKPHKFAYLTLKNSIFARFARAFFIFGHFEDVLVLSTTWNDLLCSCVDDVSIWWQMFNFLL